MNRYRLIGMNTSITRIARTLSVAAGLLAVIALFGCTTLDSVMGSVAGGIVTGPGSVRTEQAIMERAGVYELQDGMIASMVYSTVFFAGGFAPGLDAFVPGEGVTWQITTEDQGKSDGSMVIERALLRRDADGTSWWFLRYSDEESEMIAEARVGADYQLLTFRYRDPDTETIRQWEASAAKQDSAHDETDPESSMFDLYDQFPRTNLGLATVTVPAGRFDTEHSRMEIVWDDPEEKEIRRISWNWWITDDVPGNLVRYEWIDPDGAAMSGELLAFRRDYASSLGSF